LDLLEDFRVHGFGYKAGLGILLAGVIDAEEMRPIEWKRDFRAVTEFVGSAGRDEAILF
jgi:hypothetical protein